MAGWFLKLKKISGGDYAYLCRNFRENGKHRREEVYLGRYEPAWRSLRDVCDDVSGNRLKAARRILKGEGDLRFKSRRTVGPKNRRKTVGAKKGKPKTV